MDTMSKNYTHIVTNRFTRLSPELENDSRLTVTLSYGRQEQESSKGLLNITFVLEMGRGSDGFNLILVLKSKG